MEYKIYKLQCKECGKKILVDMVINGINHNMSVQATCADCLKISDEFAKENPQTAKEIKDWLNASK